eukprot:4152880-Amphidinium_carterae.1
MAGDASGIDNVGFCVFEHKKNASCRRVCRFPEARVLCSSCGVHKRPLVKGTLVGRHHSCTGHGWRFEDAAAWRLAASLPWCIELQSFTIGEI